LALDPISGIAQLMSALRQQISAQRTGGAGAPVPSNRTDPSRNSAQDVGKNISKSKDTKALEKKLRARISKLRRSGEESLEASVHAFIEGVLVAEFGDVLADDPKFHAMVDEIVAQVLGDDALKGQFATYLSRMEDDSI